MFRHRQTTFGRTTRRRITRVCAAVILILLGALSSRVIQDQIPSRLTLSPTAAAYAADLSAPAVGGVLAAEATRGLLLVEDLWGVGRGSAVPVAYMEAPRGIKAGAPLRVSVHGRQPNGSALAGALVEISWRLGDAHYRDVTFTDARGNVDVTRRIDLDCRGGQCVVGVRMYKGNLRGLAYTTFTAR